MSVEERPPVSHAFCFGLIPVQEWISQARRSRDLRAGSVLLSFVMARLLRSLLKRSALNAKVLVPLPPPEASFATLGNLSFGEALEQSYSIPNRASGLLRCTSEEEIRGAFKGLEDLLHLTWEDLRRECFRRLERDSEADFWKALSPHLESYLKRTKIEGDCPLSLLWTVVPLESGVAENGEADPREALLQADRAFRILKRSRPLPAWRLGAPVGKCNQCAAREAMGPTKDFRTWRRWHGELASLPWVERGARLKAGERLCYVCMARRVAGYLTPPGKPADQFPSTGDVAVAPWKRLAEQESAEVADLLLALDRTPLGKDDPGRALLLSPAALESLEALEELALRRKIESALVRLNSGGSRDPRPLTSSPPSYLALLTFDGDDMGQHVRREPTEVPRRLNHFAEAAQALFVRHSAAVFYLGGDEGLVMAPAEYAVDLARGLRKAFAQTFEGGRSAPTLSAGIAFFEYSRPLSGAIEAAHGALKRAKEHPGKACMAVAVESSSGKTWAVPPLPWGEGWDRIARTQELLRSGALSAGWAYDAADSVAAVPERDWGWPGALEAVSEELRRLFHRRLTLSGLSREASRAEKERCWREVSGGEGWWECSRPQPELFLLMGFLARQSAGQGQEGSTPW